MNINVTPEQLTEAARPLMKLLCDIPNPHCLVVVTGTNAELVVGACCTGEVLDYLKD